MLIKGTRISGHNAEPSNDEPKPKHARSTTSDKGLRGVGRYPEMSETEFNSLLLKTTTAEWGKTPSGSGSTFQLSDFLDVDRKD